MKLTEISNINWNSAPYSPSNKISRDVRDELCKRFEVAISNFNRTRIYNELLLKDGWVIKAKDNVVFILNADKNEDIPNNTSVVKEELDTAKLGAQIRIARDTAWDCEKYSDLAAVKGITIDANTGKIAYKVI